MRPHYLNALFRPTSIAIYGASDVENTMGYLVFKNLISAGFKGKIYPIDSNQKDIQGIESFDSLSATGGSIDLVITCSPTQTMPHIIEECGEHGAHVIISLSEGFQNLGKASKRLEQQCLDLARAHGVRILGPNCLGLIRPNQGFNACFSTSPAKPGNLALITQSGAVCSSLLDWAAQNNIGFSTVVSTGSSMDLGFGDILDFLVTDPQTTGILLSIESVHSSRRFMSGLRAAARIKPVIAIKAGRYQHLDPASGEMVDTNTIPLDQDSVFSAALARSGVVRIKDLNQLCAAARTLASRYRGSGNRIAIVTNGYGPGLLAADHAHDIGLEVATFTEATITQLDSILSNNRSHQNPLDISGTATPEDYVNAVRLSLEDPNTDGAVVILAPQAFTEPTAVAEALIAFSKECKKPILASWMGGNSALEAQQKFTDARIPCYSTPETTIDAFHFLSVYQKNQQQLLQTAGKVSRRHSPPNASAAKLIIEAALADRRKTLSEPEAYALLEAFNIPAARHGIAHSPEEALILATSIGFPVAMKVYSSDIINKSDVGGVRLNIAHGETVRSTYRELIDVIKQVKPDAKINGIVVEKMYESPNARELMVGIKQDPVFGPIIAIGSGGTTAEIHNDTAIAIPPINQWLARELVDRTRIARMLKEFRGMPAINREALIDVILRVSSMACELPWIEEMDINPLIVDEHGARAIDANIRVNYPKISPDPYHHMAIHPYPFHLVQNTQLPSGANISIRPIRPEDADLEANFVKQLSNESKYFRFMRGIHELSPEMLVRFTQIDYDQEMALMAVTEKDQEETQLGVARYVINPDTVSCEFALVIADGWQRQGLGHRLMEQLMDIARDRGLQTIEGEVLATNTKMIKLMELLDFRIKADPDDISIKMVSRPL